MRVPETDAAWAVREAAELEADATYYEDLIRRHGRTPAWVEAMREDRAVARRLRNLSRRP